MPITEVLHQREDQQQQRVVRKPMPREVSLINENGHQRKQHAHKKSQRQVEDEGRPIEYPQKVEERQQKEAAQLYKGAADSWST